MNLTGSSRIFTVFRFLCCQGSQRYLKPKLYTRGRSPYHKAEVLVRRQRQLQTLLPVSSFVSSFVSNQIVFCRSTQNLTRTFYSQDISMPEKKPFQRLPTCVKPVNYKLKLQPNLKDFTFEGCEEINVEVVNETKCILMNSADIVVSAGSYQGEGAEDKIKAEVSYQKDDETVTFTFPSGLKAGKGILHVEFTGELNDKMKGFYRNKYSTPDGEERFGATTQFEATDARRAFPCWDEPALKATFDVTLVVPKDRVALSNMPVVSETDVGENLKSVTYEQTPVMSTYLLAFVVGEYDYVEKKDSDGVLVRVYTPVGKKSQGDFALEVAVKTLPFYKNYFQVAYPLPKMDLIAITDFAAGAMENWGLVTYRETALLIDPENSSSKTKLWVALVVGHEIAHQWFGNLVTMEWWTHLWLNEGFASWIEYLCVDHCFPEYDVWTQFVNSDLGRALELDALHNSHPIEVPVGHPEEVDEIFDAISYSKGASVIRMLHTWIGDEDFKKGMNKYLTKFEYKNTFTEDLWEALGEASGKPVREVMGTWTSQMGYPVLEVTQAHNGDQRVVTVTQKKFCADGKLPEGTNPQWMVPISISSTSCPDKPAKTILLETPSTTVTIDNVKETDWIKMNTETVGVFRVQYTSEMLDALIPAIKDRSLPKRDRLGLQSDLFALANACLISAVDVLKVAEAYVNEDNYTVWSDLSISLSSISGMLQYTDFHDDFKLYIRRLFKTIADKLGWEPKDGEGPLDGMLRELVLVKLGRSGDENTIAEATKRFEDHVSGKTVLSADLRSPVYSTVLTHGGEDVYEKMMKLYDGTDLQEEKVRISRSLGSVQDEKLIERVLDFAMSDKVRSQDTVFVIAGVTVSAKGRELAWKFVQNKWSELHDRYKGGFLLSRLVKTTTETFVTEERAKEVEAFFETHPAPAAERTVQQSCENIRLKCKWLDQHSSSVREFLKIKS